MEVVLNIAKTVEENAGDYFDKTKKAKKKIKGAKEALDKFESNLGTLMNKEEKEMEKIAKKEQKKKVQRKKQWFEKFRWFRSSEGFLIIGGRDATTNEIVVKKHTDAGDIVFHTEMAGSPFFVVKAEGKKIGEETIQEVADATVSFSRARKMGLTTSNVFWVKPDQLSKKPQAGEYISRGSFIVRGKSNYVGNSVNVAVGMTADGMVMAGPVSAVKKHCKKWVEIIQGRDKASIAAKAIKKVIGGELDEIIRVLPPGEYKVKKK